MTVQLNTPEGKQYSQEQETTWRTLYQQLRPSVRYYVHRHMVPSWKGQEEEIVEDIVQETVMRVWKYRDKIERGDARPIHSLPHLGQTIAYNYCLDLMRRDRRFTSTEDSVWEYGVYEIYETVEDVALNHLLQKEFYMLVAKSIKDFPEKQREALLMDLAQRMEFVGPPTELQRAFLRVGIHLQDYQKIPFRDTATRNRYWTLLSIAYKRLKNAAPSFISYDIPLEAQRG